MSLIPPTDDDYEDENGLFWREPRDLGAYLVSISGLVLSFNNDRSPGGLLLNPPSGRTRVLDENGNRTTRTMAQLVMAAWHGPAPSGAFTVGHLNGDKTDNRAVNLFWESRHQQNLRAHRTERPTCPRGHQYDGDNLRINGAGARCCRACYRAHWWASKFRRQLAREPFDARLTGPITVDTILAISPDGRFPDGPPPLAEVRALATRQQLTIERDAARLAVPQPRPAA